jgi:hypothetical protein
MTRTTTISTYIGLLGLVMAMTAALFGMAAGLVALGFTFLLLGLLGAVIGAATSIGQAWSSDR